MLDSEGRSSKLCAGFTPPITSRSRSLPTNSTDKPGTTVEMSGRTGRAVFRLCHRPRTRTARVESISASTGPLIKQKESPLVAAWPITFSSTPSHRFARGRSRSSRFCDRFASTITSRSKDAQSKIANRKIRGGEGGIRTLGSLLGYGANETHLRPLLKCVKFRRRMSRFPARCCIMKYENILFRKKETPACAGGNHPGRPSNMHPTVCANHYHL